MKDNKDIWLIEGYKTFALSGFKGLKIEPLAKQVGKNKSSFYHHFADLDFFVEKLLKYHISRCHIVAKKESGALNIDPELINVLIEHKIDLLFNRELRINRNIKPFSETLIQSNKIVGSAFINVWVKDMNIKMTENQIDNIFLLALDNFFLQTTSESLNYDWLSSYFLNLKSTTKSLLNGSV
jgi:AcrR family transcriptional regulator